MFGVDVLQSGLHLEAGGKQAALGGAAVAVGEFPVHEERQTLLEAEFTRLGLLLLLLDGLGHPVKLECTKLVDNRVWQHKYLSSGKGRSHGQSKANSAQQCPEQCPGRNTRGHAR